MLHLKPRIPFLLTALMGVLVLLPTLLAEGSAATTLRRIGSCESVYVVDVRGWSLGDLATIVSLQGLVNRDAPRIYLVYSSGDEKLARYAVEDMLGCQLRRAAGLRELLEEFRDYVRGAIVYDPSMPDTLNLAITLAGLEDAVIVHPDNEGLVEELGLPVVADLRGRFRDRVEVYEEVYHLLPRTNQSSIAVLKPGVVNMADYAVKHRMAVLGLSPLPSDAEERRLLERILEAHPGRLAYGFFPGGGAGEHYGVLLLSKHGKTLVVADYASSLSFTEHLYPLLEKWEPGDPEPFNPAPRGVYATIFISDGDNIAFLQHLLLTKSWWYHPRRGSIPVGWTVNPWAARLAPNLVSLLRSEASSRDELVAGVAGAGHMNPVVMGDEVLEELSRSVKPFVERAGLDTLLSWDPLGYRGFKYFRDVYRYFYPSFFPSEHGFPGATVWDGRPVVYVVSLHSYEDYRGVVDSLLSRVAERPLFLAFLVNVWSFKNFSGVVELAEYLESKGIVLVGPREMAETVRRYYAWIAKPWYASPPINETLVFEPHGCRYASLYSRVSGDLLAVVRLDPYVETPSGWAWASSFNCTLRYEPPSTYVFTYKGGGVEIVKTYTVEKYVVNVSVTVEGNASEVVDVALDQLDTVTWPPRGPVLAESIVGPRYVYIPGTGVVERRLGPDPLVLCSNCSHVVVYDASYPYPRAIGLAVGLPGVEVMDAFNRGRDGVGGDYDGDGVAELHAIALKARVAGGRLAYSYTIAPLSHGWTLRLPVLDPQSLAWLLYPALQDTLYGTGFNAALSSLCPGPITTTETATVTVAGEEARTVTETVTKTVAETIARTAWRTLTKTVTYTLKLVEETTTTVTTTSTLRETVTVTTTRAERLLDPGYALALAALLLLGVLVAVCLRARK